MKTIARCAQTLALLTGFIPFTAATARAAEAPTEAPPAAADAPPAPPPPNAAPPAPAPSTTVIVVPAQPNPAVASPAPAREATAIAGSIPPPPEPAVIAPPVTEIGVQRLPGSAYPEPQTRGLKYGSLWLTFHGLQWPYLPAKAGRDRFVIGLSGWGWLDTSYFKFAPWGQNTQAVTSDQQAYGKQNGRMLLRVTPTYAFADWFVQGQVELVGTENQSQDRSQLGPAAADTDDLWLRIGQWNRWDFQVGRFEGWEVFHLGMGLDQNSFERQGAIGQGDPGVKYYGLTDNQFRPDGAAGNMAVHYYPLPILRFEALGTVGSTADGRPLVATRPVGIIDLGWLKLKGGVEYQRVTAQVASQQSLTTSKGVGGSVQFVFEPHIEFGLNAAQGTVVDIDQQGLPNKAGSFTRTSYGFFSNVSNGSERYPLMFGVGGLFTRDVDQNNVASSGVVDNYWLWQSFAAVQYVVFQQLYIKLVGSYSRAHFLQAATNPAVTYDDEMYSVRLRFAFYF